MKRLILLMASAAAACAVGCASLQKAALPDLTDPSTQALKDWLPKYPKVSKDTSDAKSVQFTTSDRATDVIAFYEEKLKAQGFSVNLRPSSGSLAPVGQGEFRPMAAERKSGNKHVEIEIAAVELDPLLTKNKPEERTVVIAVWRPGE